MSAPTSVDQLKRTVFRTYSQNSAGNWEVLSALEVGIDHGQDSKLLYTIFYRQKSGELVDITGIVQVAAQPEAQSFRIQLQGAPSNPEDLRPGLDIIVQSLAGSHASFSGTIGQLKIKGQFCAISSFSLTTMKEGEKDIPDFVKKFLAISPLVEKDTGGKKDLVDQAKLWAKDIFKDLILHALPDDAKKNYFDSIGDVGSQFKSQSYSGNELPEALRNSDSSLSLSSILSDDREMLYCAGMVFLCRSLKQSSWLEQPYKDGIQDRVDEAFHIWQGPEIKTIDHPILNTMVQKLNEQRLQYIDAINRCYFAASVCVRPELKEFFSAPLDAFEQVKKVLESENYKAFIIPKTVDAVNDPSAQTLKMRLGILHDKLALLLTMGKKYKGNWQGQTADVDEIIRTLATAAQESGLVDITNVNLEATSISLSPGSIYTDSQMSDMWRATMMEIGMNMPQATPFIQQIDIRQYQTNNFLAKEAKPLGLYNEPSFGSTLKTSDFCLIL